MKRYFITGLVILLPLAVTLFIIVLLFNLLTEPFVGIVQAFFQHYSILNDGFLLFSASQIQTLAAQILILVFLFFFTVGLGMLARWFFFYYIIRLWDYLIHRIPIVRSIYKTSQEVINSIFSADGNSFKQVVLAPFPSKDSLSIALITTDNVEILNNPNTTEMIAVYVPTTPNPTSGYLVFYKKSDLIYVDMKVETAFKYILSCGVIPAPFIPVEMLKKNETEPGT